MDKVLAHAPVLVFLYNRPDHTESTLQALAGNQGAELATVIFYCDGPNDDEDYLLTRKVREIASRYENCFAHVEYYFRDSNLGLADSLISGITQSISLYDAAIVLEDDLVTHPQTLEYFWLMLERYRNTERVFSISAYNFPESLFRIPSSYRYPIYFVHRMQCWGWATWSDRWAKADWEVPGFDQFLADQDKVDSYVELIGRDSLGTLKACLKDGKDVWACRWVYCHFVNNAVSICPAVSYVDNIGLDGSGANCGIDAKRRVQLIKDFRDTTAPTPEQPDVNPVLHEAYQRAFGLR